MPTYRLEIPMKVTIPVCTTAANESHALEIAMKGVHEFLRTWSRKTEQGITVKEIASTSYLTDELVASSDILEPGIARKR